MIFGFIALAAFMLVILGVFIGCTVSEWQLQERARRQAAAQRSLNKQWQELQTARQKIALLG